MTVAEIIDEQVVQHLAWFGRIKGMDPYAIHLLKTSNHPLMVFRRTWMRQQALKQALDAQKRQTEMNKELAKEPVRRGASIRRQAVIDPFLSEDMRTRHKATWNDNDFIGFVKKHEPGMFPRREVE
jgi:hypothetical protein